MGKHFASDREAGLTWVAAIFPFNISPLIGQTTVQIEPMGPWLSYREKLSLNSVGMTASNNLAT
jgi:hypothetical protein